MNCGGDDASPRRRLSASWLRAQMGGAEQPTLSAAASTLGSTALTVPAPVRRHENRHLLARESALLRLAAPPPCLAFSPRAPFRLSRTVRFHDPLEHLRIAPRRRQKPVTPAERRAHRHVAARRRGLHRLPLRQRRPERQPAFLVVQARQRRTGQRVEGSAAALALVAPQTPRHTARNRPFARAVRTAPGLVHTKLDRGLRCLAFAPARQHRERLAPLRARQPARRRKPHLKPLPSMTQPPDVPGTLSQIHTIRELSQIH